MSQAVTSWEMYEMVYETLLTADENLKLEPGLATSWEQTSPTSYTFKLRPDAKFSNGRPVTAEDVAGTLERIKDPKTASYWSAQLGDIATIETPDERTVKVDLKAPHPALPGRARAHQRGDHSDQRAEGRELRSDQGALGLWPLRGQGPQTG
jgi:ABC-type transport system substrate-binding protein